jgi:dipeptidyl aminopeptidase/acylaminoacyl peptidase
MSSLARIEPRQLASVPKGGISGVEWSRDNSYLLISTPSKPVAGLWRVSLEGGQPERLPVAIERQGGIRLHPGGGRIAFTRGSVQSEVWKLELLGRKKSEENAKGFPHR